MTISPNFQQKYHPRFLYMVYMLNRQSESYICTCKNDFPGQYG